MTNSNGAFSSAFGPAFDAGGIRPFIRTELKTRLDTALQASEPLGLDRVGECRSSLASRMHAHVCRPSWCAYGGATVVGDFRHAAQVVMIYSQSRDKTAFVGHAVCRRGSCCA